MDKLILKRQDKTNLYSKIALDKLDKKGISIWIHDIVEGLSRIYQVKSKTGSEVADTQKEN